MLSFKAKYISPVNIEKKTDSGHFKKYQVSLVELDPVDSRDLNCVKKTSLSWEKGNSLAEDIAISMQDEFINGRTSEMSKYYAITTQVDDLKNLVAKKILGLAGVLTTEDKNVDYIDIIQISPNYTKENKNRKYRYIGKTLLNAIKNLAPNKDLILEAREAAVGFYQKNGFKLINDYGFMIFKR